ncbi:MAG: nuclear transport factor 2 family protein [Betaproteobacteria bacterium]
MSSQARLLQDVDEAVEAWRLCLRKGDIEQALSLWFDEDTVTCILPDGVRLIGHIQLREGLSNLMNRPIILDTLTSTSHTYLGVTFIDSTEAIRFDEETLDPSLFLHMTMILVQGTMGWRIAHLHSSQVPKEAIQSPSLIGDHGFH